jgi:hypothetical protein
VQSLGSGSVEFVDTAIAARCYLSVFRKAPAMAANIGIDAVRPMSQLMGWRENFIAQIAETKIIDPKIPILFFMPAMLSRF